MLHDFVIQIQKQITPPSELEENVTNQDDEDIYRAHSFNGSEKYI
jgi:hypothetical protein